MNKAEVSLQEYATSGERANDSVQNIVALAKNANQSVAGYLIDQLEQRNQMLTGNPTETIEQLNIQFSNNTSSGNPLVIEVQKIKTERDSRGTELNARVVELDEKDQAIQSLKDQLDDQETTKKAEMQLVKSEWQDVQDESEI